MYIILYIKYNIQVMHIILYIKYNIQSNAHYIIHKIEYTK